MSTDVCPKCKAELPTTDKQSDKWVFLTDYEIAELCVSRKGWPLNHLLGFARAVEAKAMEKNL